MNSKIVRIDRELYEAIENHRLNLEKIFNRNITWIRASKFCASILKNSKVVVYTPKRKRDRIEFLSFFKNL